ncbi:hypothetical protein D0Z03_000849 [Geotrichum reessii]|nr:hypothetical protein D0Z03_000849 [Galactomyces reessii]
MCSGASESVDISMPVTPKSYTFSQTRQPAHPLTMIPGPIEFDDQVLAAMSHPAQGHTSPAFIKTFQETLGLVRNLFYSSDPAAQGFVISGSGTLGWDFVGANLIEAGENALVLNTGFFSESFTQALTTYGANVDEISTEFVGDKISLAAVETALKNKKYKLVTITHVDTSTGVLTDIKAIAKLVKSISPETLVVVDGVCSVAVEEIKFDDWQLDFVLTASQKGVGAPSGLSIFFASAQALQTVADRKTPVGSFYASIPRWLPVMRAYEAGNPAYFATPPVQNVYGLRASLRQFAFSKAAMDNRFASHVAASNVIKDAIAEIGLKTVSLHRDSSAHGMTAVYLPEGITNAQLLPLVAEKGVVLAGGLHKQIAAKYFRIGHMGISAVYPSTGHIQKVVDAISEALYELGYKK